MGTNIRSDYHSVGCPHSTCSPTWSESHSPHKLSSPHWTASGQPLNNEAHSIASHVAEFGPDKVHGHLCCPLSATDSQMMLNSASKHVVKLLLLCKWRHREMDRQDFPSANAFLLASPDSHEGQKKCSFPMTSNDKGFPYRERAVERKTHQLTPHTWAWVKEEKNPRSFGTVT